jgi:transcription elongation factor SPT5
MPDLNRADELQIKAFSKDVRKAADTAGGTAREGLYDVHDMVMLE